MAKLHSGFTFLTDNNVYLVGTAALVDFNSSKLSAILDQRSNSSHCLLLNCLLLLCGDIQDNPGPSKCQCGLCDKVVRSNQDAIECEECQISPLPSSQIMIFQTSTAKTPSLVWTLHLLALMIQWLIPSNLI